MPLGLFKERRLAMAAGLLLGGLFFAYLLWPAPKNGPAIALPVPNGYDDLLRAAT